MELTEHPIDELADDLAAYDGSLRHHTTPPRPRGSPRMERALDVVSLLHAANRQVSADPRFETIGRFVIGKLLGQGTFGIVYRAFDPQLGRHVALKVAKDLRGDEQRIRRFLREAAAVAGLRHPCIVPVFEFGEDRGTLFIAFAYIAGRTLQDEIKVQSRASGACDPRWAASIVAMLADGLAHAHAQGIVHRDVKPSNVMVDETGNALLTDFGLATRQDGAERLTHSGQILGTPLYMAPEQAIGRTDAVTASSDQYSLGVVLFEMLAGRPPFLGPPERVLVHHLESDVPPVTKFQASAPRDLATICFKCLEKHPERRYASCNDLAADLRRWLSGVPIVARRQPWWESAMRWGRRRPALVSLLAILVIILIGACIVGSRLQGDFDRVNHDLGEAETRAKVERDKVKELDIRGERVRYVHAVRAAQSALLRDNIHLAQHSMSPWKQKSGAKLPTLELDLLTPDWGSEQVGTAPMRATVACYSHDNKYLAAGGNAPHADVCIWNRESLKEVHRLKGHAADIHALEFSPDSRWLASTDQKGECRIWNVETGAVVSTAKRPSSWNRVAFHPTRPLLYGAIGSEVVVFSLPDLRELRSIRHGSEVYAFGVSPTGAFVASGGFEESTLALHSFDLVRPLGILDCTTPKRRYLEISPDGERLATSMGNDVGLWNIAARELEQTFIPNIVDAKNPDGIHSIVFVRSDPDRLVVASSQGRAVVFRLSKNTHHEVKHFGYYDLDDVRQYGVAGEGSVIAAPNQSAQNLMFIDLRWPPSPFRDIPAHQGIAFETAFTRDSRHVATCGRDGQVHLWDVPTGAKVKSYPSDLGTFALATANTRDDIAVAYEDHSIRIIDQDSGKTASS